MATKVLINSIGQHIIADVKSVTNRETEELVAYWVTEPRRVVYVGQEDGTTSISLASTCPIAITTEYAIQASDIVTVLDPTEEMAGYYEKEVNPEPANVVVGEAPSFEEVVNDNTETVAEEAAE